MKHLLTVVAAIVAIVVAVLLVIASMQPDEYTVERTATMDAPAPVVFDKVQDFRHWDDWSPWTGRVPDEKAQYDGADRGEGAIYEWASHDRDIGAGRMTIIEADTPHFIKVKLEFFEPAESTTTTSFDFVAVDDDTTEVTWSMSGENTFLSKTLALFLNIEQMIGADYEQGLADLGEISRQAASDAPR